MTGSCVICGKWAELDIDHIKTVGSGGLDIDNNIWRPCRSCHINKHRYGLQWIIDRYPHTKQILNDKGWEIQVVFGRNKLIRRG